MSAWNDFVEEYLSKVYIPKVGITDIFEIVIIAFLLYHIMVWVKDTKAWALLKGVLVLIGFALLAILFNLQTILWIASKTLSVGIIAVVIIFQPELRKALEQLGRKKIISQLNLFEDNKDDEDAFSQATVSELVKASFELGRTKTGALIVIENDMNLDEYVKTGIMVDGVITSQLMINIFEHNTPLHDGAVVIRGNRIVAATCYLPLSDNMHISKDLGTRHRAGLGVSEATDALTIIVSEETGRVSVAKEGVLETNLDATALKNKLSELLKDTTEVKTFKLWKGRLKDEKKAAE